MGRCILKIRRCLRFMLSLLNFLIALKLLGRFWLSVQGNKIYWRIFLVV